MKNENVRLTKSGRPIWASNSVKALAIMKAMKELGFDVAISEEDILKHRYYIARSTTTVTNRIESKFRTAAQRNKAINEWNRYDHLHDSIRTVNRDVFERLAVEKELGTNSYIKL